MGAQTNNNIPIEGCLLENFLPPKFKCQDQVLRLDLNALGMHLPENAYAFQVRDNSMIGAGILPGDIAILAPGMLQRGDIVAIRVNRQLCLRRYVLIMDIPHFLAENSGVPSLLFAQGVTTYGALWSLVRTTGLSQRLQNRRPEVSYSKDGPLQFKAKSFAQRKIIFQKKLGDRLQRFGVNELLLSDSPPVKGYQASRPKKEKKRPAQ